MKRLVILGGAALMLASCASLRPGAEGVVLTRDQTAVAGCKEVGFVQSWISFSFGDARNQIRNRAASLGGDKILVTSTFGDTTGTAYSCGSRRP